MKKKLDTTSIANELKGASAFFGEKPSTEPASQKTKKTPANKPSKKTRRYRDTTTPRHHDTMTPVMVESVRKVVKQVGLAAATHRFTPEEKQAIADIVYTYARQGYKTSENEIVRIGINWLVLDYKENGKKSILEKVIRALKE